ncbi:hypothetical protein K8B33_07650 [Alcanivorax sp. JB21]|uniref:tetratricopeptide repeat protein n=1 Tax=Alcanivorax limicola TaxID=2874102 RepID=UPI001CBEB002|nr:hypothetical protein [Alcanivorax limicola]MBZ2188966.1 hypothetical protein [Alcanivorax limicola]
MRTVISPALLLLVLFVAGISDAIARDDANTSFQQGVEAFRNDDFLGARDYFLRARNLGMESPGLYYNLGVASYRLRDYATAEDAFLSLQDNQAWRGLAFYNIALIAERQADPQRAREFYRNAWHTGDSRVSYLAEQALDRLGDKPPGYAVFLSLSLGHDSNVTFSPEQSSADDADQFANAYVNARYDLNPDWHLEGSAYGRRNASINEFDTSFYDAAIRRSKRFGEWHGAVGAKVTTQFLDGEKYQTAYGSDAFFLRSVSDSTFVGAGLDVDRVQAGSNFEYLDGWRVRGHMRWSTPVQAGRLQSAYRIEANDRSDLRSEDDFASFSPLRHRLRLSLRYPINLWTVTSTLGYEHSHYQRRYRIGDERVQRLDDMLTVSLRADRYIRTNWVLFGQIDYTDNDSTIANNRYQRHEFQLGLEILVP